LASGGRPTKNELDLGDLRLDQLHVLDLDLRQPDGAPLQHASVQMFQERAGAGAWDAPPLVPWLGDRSGRLRLLLPDGNLALSVAGGKGLCRIQEIELTDKFPRHQKLTLTMEPMLRVAGLVKNRRGLPVPGVQFRISGTSSRGGGPPQHMRNAIDDLNRRSLQGTSDEHGRFELFHISQPTTQFRLGVTLRAGGQSYHNHNALQLGDEPIETAEVEIDCPDELAVGKGVVEGEDKK
jgi:hypothetical protein